MLAVVEACLRTDKSPAVASFRLNEEIGEIDRALLRVVSELGPALLAERGVGTVCAALLLVSSGDTQGWRARRPSQRWLAPARSTRPAANSGATGSTAAAADSYQRLLASGITAEEARRCVTAPQRVYGISDGSGSLRKLQRGGWSGLVE